MAAHRKAIQRLRTAGFRLSFVILLIATLFACCTFSSASGKKLTVLYTFNGGQDDGDNPWANPTLAPNGVLYGTTQFGGNLNCEAGLGLGCGEIWQLVPPARRHGAWSYSEIYEFTGGNDGYWPTTGLTLDTSGDLYGVTGGLYGGAASLFELAAPGQQGAAWTYQDIYDFGDEIAPNTPLLIDNSGALYGIGGVNSNNYNAVVQFVPTKSGPWTQNVLYQFSGGADGAGPSAIVMDSSGMIYGIAASGGTYGAGDVFQLAPGQGGTWAFSVLYSFTGSPDSYPFALAQDASGNLYGLAANSSSSSSSSEVFQLALQNGAWTNNVLYVFSWNQFCGYPPATLTAAPNGTVYGTTGWDWDFYGGSLFEVAPPAGQGPWTFNVQWDFNKQGPEWIPNGVVVAPSGLLYGTIEGDYSDGDVFQFTPGKSKNQGKGKRYCFDEFDKSFVRKILAGPERRLLP